MAKVLHLRQWGRQGARTGTYEGMYGLRGMGDISTLPDSGASDPSDPSTDPGYTDSSVSPDDPVASYFNDSSGTAAGGGTPIDYSGTSTLQDPTGSYQSTTYTDPSGAGFQVSYTDPSDPSLNMGPQPSGGGTTPGGYTPSVPSAPSSPLSNIIPNLPASPLASVLPGTSSTMQWGILGAVGLLGILALKKKKTGTKRRTPARRRR